MIRRMAPLLLPLGLTACLGACLGAGKAADPGAQDACGAAAMQGLVGRPLTAFDSAAPPSVREVVARTDAGSVY